jgi:hypothetical protein
MSTLWKVRYAQRPLGGKSSAVRELLSAGSGGAGAPQITWRLPTKPSRTKY